MYISATTSALHDRIRKNRDGDDDDDDDFAIEESEHDNEENDFNGSLRRTSKGDASVLDSMA